MAISNAVTAFKMGDEESLASAPRKQTENMIGEKTGRKKTDFKNMGLEIISEKTSTTDFKTSSEKRIGTQNSYFKHK